MFPEQLGPWQQEATYELGKSAMQLLECQGYIHRGYRNRETGDYIKLSVMVGPGSKMSIHVPEICYEASNFSLLGERERFVVAAAGQEHEFWSVTFQVNDVSERRVRVLYGWSTGQRWLAPRMPRWSVAGYPVLYKLQLSYVINDVLSRDPTASDELLDGFVQQTLPVLQQLIGDSPDAPPGNLPPTPDTSATPAFLMTAFLDNGGMPRRQQSPAILLVGPDLPG